MGRPHKIILAVAMSLALGFGFLPALVPDFPYAFERLHIFLFNLCSGGFVLLWYAQRMGRVTANLYAWLVLSVAYAVSAFLEAYAVTLVLSLPLFGLVELARIRRFSFLPLDFFRATPTSDKFLHASLLCLSTGLLIASFVILNNEYLHLVHAKKLTIDVFFLGFSFPLSLLTFSVMFQFMPGEGSRTYTVLKEIGFWMITGGVIVFFVFIILEQVVLELLIANMLLAAVCMVYWLFAVNSRRVQQRSILLSGMGFLVATGLTGVGYLLEYIWPEFAVALPYMLTLHATVSLYGWNLSGLFIVSRWEDFPITRNTPYLIGLHWLTVLVLAPLGKHVPWVSAIALPAYALLLCLVFFGRSPKRA